MEKLVIQGGVPLQGEVTISGAKNAAVAIIPAAILVEGTCRIENIPSISDVTLIVDILYQMGASIKMVNKHTLEIDCSKIKGVKAPYDMVSKMRASYYLIGALLGRFGMAQVAMPGGCDIGVRPIDQHIKGFEALGADVETVYGMIEAKAPETGLVGNSVFMDVISVGATINTILAATRAKGMTVIENAAREPHVVDLANFLNAMGADIKGAGTDVIKIRGVDKLYGGTYSIIPDQIEAMTYMAMAAATSGELLIKNVIPKHLEPVTAKLLEMNVSVVEDDDSILVRRTGPISKSNIKTQPYPGFPTDMQPQMAVLMCLAEGTSIINEGIWENRFKYVDELKRMGANIQVDGKVAVIEGPTRLSGAPVRACDLRAGAAMVIAGLVADGITEIESVDHIERGYEDIVGKLRAVGAKISKVRITQDYGMEKAQ